MSGLLGQIVYFTLVSVFVGINECVSNYFDFMRNRYISHVEVNSMRHKTIQSPFLYREVSTGV